MTSWYHECNPEWLKVRKHYLTASEVMKLLPVTASGRKRSQSQIDQAYDELIANKLVQTVDPVSVGHAARGHIMEPYAIDEFNKLWGIGTSPINHWDDCLITNGDYLLAGYSPDGLDIVQSDDAVIKDIEQLEDIDVLAEVKCYAPYKHMMLGKTNLEDLEERWQIAMGMLITKAEKGILIGFNPDMPKSYRLVVRNFFIDDLEDEIFMIKDIIDEWRQRLKNETNASPLQRFMHESDLTTADIIAMEAELKEFNPSV